MIMSRIGFFITLVTVIAFVHAEQSNQLNMTASPWSPFVSRDLAGNGVAVCIVTKALQRAGYKTTFALLEWPRDLEGTKLGEYDVITSIWYTEERAADLVFSEPIIENRIKLMVHADSDIHITETGTLKGYRVGLVEDYAYTEGIYKKLPGTLIKANTVEENLQHLLAGKIDVAVVDEQVALYVLNNKIPGGIKQIRFVDEPLSTRYLRMAVSRKRTDADQIISDFNAAFQGMKEDGSYLDFLHRFRISP